MISRKIAGTDISSEQSQHPLVSVLMPVRNEEQYIVDAITAVLEQNVDLELLIIDGASTDRTVELVTAFDDPRVVLLANPKRTIPAALNIALSHAKGSYVARIDAHARVNREYLRLGLEQLADPDVAAAGGIRIAVADTDTGKAIAAALSSPFGVGNSINHYADTAQDTDHASFGVYRIEVARAVGGWDENLLVNEDVDFDHRIALAGHRIRFDPKMKIYWQVRETLPAFARQYRRYGRGKAGMLRKNGPKAMRLRHLAAPAAVGMLGAAGLSVVVGRRGIALALAAPYLVVVVAATAVARRSPRTDRRVSVLTLASSFPTMHLTWGIGFLEGLLFGRPPVAATAPDPLVTRPRR